MEAPRRAPRPGHARGIALIALALAAAGHAALLAPARAVLPIPPGGTEAAEGGTSAGAGPALGSPAGPSAPIPTPVASPSPHRSPEGLPSASGSSPGGSSPRSGRPPTPVPLTTPRVELLGSSSGCGYLDLPTRYAGYDDWDRTLLDTVYRLPSGYAPPDLVDVAAAGLGGGHRVRHLVIEDLAAMAAAAREAGAPFVVVSGYRSYATQDATFRRWVAVEGYRNALRTSARPGHSEHQLGTAIDVTSAGGRDPWTYRDWGTTKAGAWIAEHAWRYGFLVSYPRGSFVVSCYDYEPWHLRYFGRERAAAIQASGLTPREFLLALP